MSFGDSLGASEILGAAEILGAVQPHVLEDILGASHPLLRAVRKSVVSNTPDKARRLIQGIAPVSVAAAALADVTCAPQQLFRTERVIIPSSIAFFFAIEDVKVGNRSQFVASGQVPGAAFTEVAIDAYVHWDTANVGNIITVSVQNIDTATHVFRAVLFGTAAIT